MKLKANESCKITTAPNQVDQNIFRNVRDGGFFIKSSRVFIALIFCFGFFVESAVALDNSPQLKAKIEDIRKDNTRKYTEKECLALTVDANNKEKSNLIKRIVKLKTVIQFDSLIKKNNSLEENKTNKVFLSFEFIEPRYISNKCFWNVYAKDNHPTHSLLWKSFLVEISGTDIYEEDQADGSYRIIK